MSIFDWLFFVGGLALFLYGMHLMEEGLKQMSGGHTETILKKMTSNSQKGVLAGAAVTALIQSSSAVTVMLVGLVDSGIMRLEQTVGIIMGANIGTTVTSWLLSLTGIHGENIWLRFLKPASFSPVLAITGVFLILFGKKERKQNIGTVLMGIAVILFGMERMREAVMPLAAAEEFQGYIIRFSHPLYGMLAGMLITAVIQSSSASMGILQALCATGSVSYRAAIPVILGQNIGTCVTAVLAAVGAGKNARRTACIHLYFNSIGTLLFMAVFYPLYALFGFSFVSQKASEAGVAAIHSAFNIAAVIVLLPFSKGLVILAKKTI